MLLEQGPEFEASAYRVAICLVTALRSAIERPTTDPLLRRGAKQGPPFEDIGDETDGGGSRTSLVSQLGPLCRTQSACFALRT